MPKEQMDKSGLIIIKICVFSIVLSFTAILLCGIFRYFDKRDTPTLSYSSTGTVIIDAGHGGEDGGASAADGTKEKDLNLSVALSLGDMLELSGYNVIYTRKDDRMLYKNDQGSKKMQDLKQRLDIAKQTDDAIFVSIHMNKFTQEKYSGLQVFYSKNNPASQNIANIIQNNARNMIQKENDREIKSAGSNIYILDNIKNPAVMVECGFLSNPKESELLKDESYQKEVAAVIYSSLIEFFELT